MSERKMLPHSVVIKTVNGGEMIATRAGKFMGDYGSGTISFEALIVLGLKNVSVTYEKGHFNLFLLKLNPVTVNTKHIIACQEFGEIITRSETSLWCRRLGHLNRRHLQVLNLPFSDEKCPQCIEDVSGPVKTATKEAEENFMNFIKMVKTQHRNSKAERMNLTLMNKVRTKFADRPTPHPLGEAVCASAYELNRSPTSVLQNSTPASVWFGENHFSKLRVFGSQAYMRSYHEKANWNPV
ncbi:hypothetical protein PR048_011682 [Dryococelus australis]|uniref:GAG-pre-integrase domain-containing protein n=1 Tax=Dryococelus australis TaxID=614101 RepID=A0ABQ9HM99_9NEOP|nr:hypothetical protein PR048_011682 [Dryococelus australis]